MTVSKGDVGDSVGGRAMPVTHTARGQVIGRVGPPGTELRRDVGFGAHNTSPVSSRPRAGRSVPP
ncbi:hypothetical protein [Nocardiopsis sp. NRRL B-16309]|uniref:hypothetical protein n=1 Tax=Nocardiopsis sp. NRRL B-16309 TaxID=1519494 RepID=UPI00373FC809